MLLVLRLAQGFALGGEWSGAALVATENAPAGKRAWYGTFPQLGAPLGFIIANSVFLAINFLLPHPDGTGQRSEAFLAWGWRVPFLFSAVMVIIGLWVRLRLVESETFVKAEEKGAIRKFPLGTVLPPSLVAPDPRHVHHAGDLRAVLPDDELHAVVRHEGRRPATASAAAAGRGRSERASPSTRPRSRRSSIRASASATPTS